MSVLVPFEYILLDNNRLAVRTESVIYILRYLRQFHRTFRIVEIIVRQIADVFNFLSYQSAFSVNWIPLLVNFLLLSLRLTLLLVSLRRSDTILLGVFNGFFEIIKRLFLISDFNVCLPRINLLFGQTCAFHPVGNIQCALQCIHCRHHYNLILAVGGIQHRMPVYNLVHSFGCNRFKKLLQIDCIKEQSVNCDRYCLSFQLLACSDGEVKHLL